MKFLTLFATAAITGAALLASATSALAIEAQSTTELNIRTGPGTDYAVLDALTRGEVVSVRECTESNWCYIEHEGPDGWVSARYLAAVPEATPPAEDSGASGSGRDCKLRLTLGSGRPTMELVCGSSGPETPPESPDEADPALLLPEVDQVCFFRDPNFTGPSFCRGPGRINSLPPAFDNKISSVQLHANAVARLCVNPNLGGYCAEIVHDAPNLGPLLDNRASSLKVYVPGVPGTPSAPPHPTTYKTGPLTLQPGQAADFDTGTLGGGGTDLWYRAGGGLPPRFQPIRGAQIALGDGSNRGFAGCSTASFSSTPVPLWKMPVGTYVCTRTNQGRVSQFRVNQKDGNKVKLGFTTWAN